MSYPWVQAQEQSPYWVPPSAKPSPSLAQLPAGGSSFPGAKPCRLWRQHHCIGPLQMPRHHLQSLSLMAQADRRCPAKLVYFHADSLRG